MALYQVTFFAGVARTGVAIGTLVGLELPLLMRLLEGQLELKDIVSRVLTFDYIGALAAALMFPLVLVPHIGLVRSSLVMGTANAAVRCRAASSWSPRHAWARAVDSCA